MSLVGSIGFMVFILIELGRSDIGSLNIMLLRPPSFRSWQATRKQTAILLSKSQAKPYSIPLACDDSINTCLSFPVYYQSLNRYNYSFITNRSTSTVAQTDLNVPLTKPVVPWRTLLLVSLILSGPKSPVCVSLAFSIDFVTETSLWWRRCALCPAVFSGFTTGMLGRSRALPTGVVLRRL